MNLNNPHVRNFIVCMIVFVIGMISFVFWLFSETADMQLMEAQEKYIEGIKTESLIEKEAAFNRTLEIYLQLEKEYPQSQSDGKLYYNIGHTYAQLEQLPWALLYFYRAEVLMPGYPQVVKSLEYISKQLGVAAVVANRPLSQPSCLQLFVLFGVIATFAASFWIWRPYLWVKMLTGATTMLSLLFLSFAIWMQFIAPVRGVMIDSGTLMQRPHAQSKTVLLAAVPKGALIHVIASTEHENWYQIKTLDGDVGYLPAQIFRLI